MSNDDAIGAVARAADAHAARRAPDDARLLPPPELDRHELVELRRAERQRLSRLRNALDDAFKVWAELVLVDDDTHLALDRALTDAYVILDALSELGRAER